jgi:hypothetical protein
MRSFAARFWERNAGAYQPPLLTLGAGSFQRGRQRVSIPDGFAAFSKAVVFLCWE